MDRSVPWQVQLNKCGTVFAPLDEVPDQLLAEEIRSAALRPVGVNGFVVGYCVDRESELLADGLTDLNVSARPGISEDTAGTHVRHIFRKLGVHSRAELLSKVRS